MNELKTLKHHCSQLKSFNITIEKILKSWTINFYKFETLFPNIEGISFCPYCGEKLK